MKNFLALVKLLFSQQFHTTFSGDKKKRTGTIVAFVVLGIIFVPMLVGIAFAMYAVGTIMGANQGVVALLILVSQTLVLMLGLPTFISGVFMPKDADKLLYLPLKPVTIFSAKLTVAYLNEVITSAVSILFLLVPYGIGANMGVGYYLMLLPALLLIPLLPIFLEAIISMPFALLLSKVGKNGLGKTFMTIVFFLLFMAVYMSLMFGLMDLEASMPNGELTMDQLIIILQDSINQIASKMVYIHPNYVLAGSLISVNFVTWLTNLLVTLAEFAILGTLAILIAQPFYKFMLASEVEGGGGGGKKAKLTYDTKPTSVIKQLMITDFKRTLRDSQLGFQSFAGIVMMPLLVIVFGVTMSKTPTGEDPINFADPLYQLISTTALVGYFALLGSCTNTLGLYPITRENNSFYIMKTLPIPFTKVLMAKVLLSTILLVAVSLLTTIVAVFTMSIKWYIAIGMMVVLSLIGFGTQCITTRIDLKSPKFGWTSFQQSLKNSKNTWIAMLVGLLAMIIIGVVAFGAIMLYIATELEVIVPLMWIVLTIISGLFAFVSYKILINNSERLFSNIEG